MVILTRNRATMNIQCQVEFKGSLWTNGPLLVESKQVQRKARACNIHIRAYSPFWRSSMSCVPSSMTTESFIYLGDDSMTPSFENTQDLQNQISMSC